ncbi:hypothetical protein [uncultured Variovorax sp.]|uniref:hypothetical protein n=1 Tax=uncultured Variovorax sp. TaxID=114708 RepID=UPI002609A4E6|nr:hypothetical protein [uncultured Variovorax sp.]
MAEATNPITTASNARVGEDVGQPQPGDLNYRSEWETSREISHDEAREIARRLIASHFRRTDCETARVGIPARPDYDDDLLICSYIKQQSRKEAETLQARNAAWMRIAFADDPTDLPERIARFGEEALELQQALGQSREDAHALVDYVYSRPAGAPATEFGQAAGSLACLAEFAGHDLEAAAEAELDRVSTPEFLAKLRAKRATRHGRGPLPGFSAPSTSEPEAPTSDACRQAARRASEQMAWAAPSDAPSTPEAGE